MLKVDNLELHTSQQKVLRDGHEIELSNLEYQLLEYLVRHKNQNVSRAAIARDVWKKPQGVGTNVIDVYVKSLRDKLDRPETKQLIHTIRGVGYSLGDQEQDKARANAV